MWSAVVAAVLLAALGYVYPDVWSSMLIAVPSAGIAGAAAFGVIGLIAASLYLKPVGWTFIYATFGAILMFAAAFLLAKPLATSASSTDFDSGADLLALIVAPVVGLIAGALTAARLKNTPIP